MGIIVDTKVWGVSVWFSMFPLYHTEEAFDSTNIENVYLLNYMMVKLKANLHVYVQNHVLTQNTLYRLALPLYGCQMFFYLFVF